MIKPLAAIIFNFILNIFINEEHKPAYPVNLVLDEFTDFGRIDGIEDQILIIRQRGIPILFGCQNWLQLKKVYGLDDSGILYSQTATKFIFRAQDLDTAKKVSETLGRKTVVERKMSSSGHLTEREFGRPLMETDELMAMQDTLIETTSGIQPLMTKGYSWQDLTYATNLPAYERRLLEIDDRLTEVCAKTAVDPIPVDPVLAKPTEPQIQPATAPATAEPVTSAPVTQPTQEPVSTPVQREVSTPTYQSTMQEMVGILNWSGEFSKQFDYLSWYLKGAQIDPKPILQGGDDWVETVLRYFVADDLVSTWNLTQDTFLRLIVPFLLAMALWKGTEFAFSKISEGRLN